MCDWLRGRLTNLVPTLQDGMIADSFPDYYYFKANGAAHPQRFEESRLCCSSRRLRTQLCFMFTYTSSKYLGMVHDKVGPVAHFSYAVHFLGPIAIGVTRPATPGAGHD